VHEPQPLGGGSSNPHVGPGHMFLSHGRFKTTATPERALVSIWEWPLHVAVIDVYRFTAETVSKRPFRF
jgi:hypothetical protein